MRHPREEFDEPFPRRLLDLLAAVPLGAMVAAAFLVAGAMTSYYTVEAEEVGVLIRFGRHVQTVEPGLHFRLPFWIDRVEKVPVRRQHKQEFGFGTAGASNPYQSSREVREEKNMVTGDLNAAEVEWVVQYRVEDPVQYLFHVRQPDETLRAATESVMREVVGDRTVDEVITVGRQEIESETLAKLQRLVKAYELGVRIDQVQLKNVNPPPAVQPSFNEVNQAQQERERTVNNANEEYNKEVPKARGEAERMIQEAEGYALQRINEAEGDAERFQAVFARYREAPDVTRRRLYLETMAKVFPATGPRIIVDEDAERVVPLLQLPQGQLGGRPGLLPSTTAPLPGRAPAQPARPAASR